MTCQIELNAAPAGGNLGRCGVPTGIRTPVTSVKGMCPRPLDDGDAGHFKHSIGCT
jgi:hypothetical protein